MSKKKLVEPILNEVFFTWIAPDGGIQIGMTAPDAATCVAYAKLLSTKKLSQSPYELRMKGFFMQKVKVTIEPIYDDESDFVNESLKEFEIIRSETKEFKAG